MHNFRHFIINIGGGKSHTNLDDGAVFSRKREKGENASMSARKEEDRKKKKDFLNREIFQVEY